MPDLMPDLNRVFQDTFGDDMLQVTRGTTARDVDAWDSLNHVVLVLAVERAFGVRFSSAEVDNMKTVGDLHDLILRHQEGH